jgi:hypothetical protein
VKSTGRPLGSLLVLLSAWVVGRAVAVSGVMAGEQISPPQMSAPKPIRLAQAPSIQPSCPPLSAPFSFSGTADTGTRLWFEHNQRTAPHFLPEHFYTDFRQKGQTMLAQSSVHILAPRQGLPSVVQPEYEKPGGANLPPRTAQFLEEPRPAAFASPQPWSPNRLSVSAWTLWRPQVSPGGSVLNGQLGGSQTGARVDYRISSLGRNRTLHAYWRVSTPLTMRSGQENAFGLTMKLGRAAPLLLNVERRFGPRDAMAVFVSGGTSDHPILKGLKLDAYGQTGFVGLRSKVYFADGALTISRQVEVPLAGKIDLGIGLWGASQPGLRRIDIGPAVTVHPIIASKHFRLSAQWRQRITGNANPVSGPALTLGADF